MQTDEQMGRHEANSRFSQLLCERLCQSHGCMRCGVWGCSGLWCLILCYSVLLYPLVCRYVVAFLRNILTSFSEQTCLPSRRWRQSVVIKPRTIVRLKAFVLIARFTCSVFEYESNIHRQEMVHTTVCLYHWQKTACYTNMKRPSNQHFW